MLCHPKDAVDRPGPSGMDDTLPVTKRGSTLTPATDTRGIAVKKHALVPDTGLTRRVLNKGCFLTAIPPIVTCNSVRSPQYTTTRRVSRTDVSNQCFLLHLNVRFCIFSYIYFRFGEHKIEALREKVSLLGEFQEILFNFKF